MVKLFESGFNGFKRGTWEEALAQPDWSKQVEFVNSSSNVKDDDDDDDGDDDDDDDGGEVGKKQSRSQIEAYIFFLLQFRMTIF